MRIYQLSGLPRSGTTLLSNILAQNPRVHATHTSGLLETLFDLRNRWDTFLEHKAHPLPAAKARVLRAVYDAYHAGCGKEVVIDKSRGWVAYLPMLEAITGARAKVLFCYRAVPDILASFEGLRHEAAKLAQPPDEAKYFYAHQHVEGRCNVLLQADNVLGMALNRINDLLESGMYRDRVHPVAFDDLTARPRETLRGVYEFLGEAHHEHDFERVEQVTSEDDGVHGYPGLHTIRPKVEPQPSRAEKWLGPHLVVKYGFHNVKLP